MQYADPVADLLDKWGVFRARLFRESCVFHRGNYVKVRHKMQYFSVRFVVKFDMKLCSDCPTMKYMYLPIPGIFHCMCNIYQAVSLPPR